MDIGVQVASWEQQCCGERFAVGDRVEWQLFAADAVDFLGADEGHDVHFGESHHGGLDLDTMAVVGEVIGIREIRQAVHRAGPGAPWTNVIGASNGIDVDHVPGRAPLDPDAPALAAEPEPGSEPEPAPVLSLYDPSPAPRASWTIGPSQRVRPDPVDAHVGWVVRLRVLDGTALPGPVNSR